MHRMSAKIILVVVTILFASQIGRTVVRGLPPFGSFSGGPFDIVNNANLNVHFEFPILSKGGRGLPLDFRRGYDSWFWYNDGTTWIAYYNYGGTATSEAFTGMVNFNTTQGSCTVNGTQYFYNIYSDWDYHGPTNPRFMADFGDWPVSDASLGPCTGAPPLTYTAIATDNTGFTIVANAQNGGSATIYSRSGTVIVPAISNPNATNGSFTDTNGNQLTMTSPGDGSTSITDTLGITAVNKTGSNPILYTYTSAAGTQQNVSLYGTTYTIQTNFGCSGISEFGPITDTLVTSVVYPDGSSYSFTYEVTPGDNHTPHYITGRIASVTLPTGGQISYTYTGSNNGVICGDGSTAGLTRQTPDGTWTYTRSGSDPQWTTTITDPQGNQTVLNFQGTDYLGTLETQRQIYQGSTSGTLLKTVYTCYNGASYPCNTTSITLPITQMAVTTKWPSGQTSQMVTNYNSYGSPTEVDEYGYGSGSVGSMVRKTVTQYASLGNYINDHPSSIAVYAAGASNPSSQTIYTYDQGSVTTTSGTPQHVLVSGSRGNVTTTTYSVTSSSTFSTTATYFDTGMVQTTTDSKGNQTGNDYSGTSCGNSFATSISMPLSLSRSQTWNCNGGLLASKTDENGQVTNYSYDLMNRPAQTNYPDGGWDLMTYTGANQQDTYRGITDTTPSTSCTSCSHTQQNLDTQGRESTTILVSDPEGQTTASATYDSLGRIQRKSTPYRSTGDPTYGLTADSYDALDRLSTISHPDANVASIYYGSDVGGHGGAATQLCSSSTYGLGHPTLTVDEMGMKHQTWADALGRQIEADEPDSSNNMTLGTCYAYDALDDLTQVVQGSQTRSYAYDMLSRRTSETVPESGSMNSYYTTSGGSLCSGNPQAICRNTDARGITTTANYDALNRITSKTYSDSTPAANFYYDESSVTISGTQYTLANTKGRLSHTSAASGAAMTVHSYDRVGRHQDLWQCTPYNCSSATIWNAHYAYDLAGDTTSWQHPAGETFSNTISNAQRITQISSSLSDSTHPGTLAQNIKYAPHGAVSGLQNGCVGTGCTQRQETYDYNNRLQAVRNQLGTSATPNANSCLVYNYYYGAANPTSCAIPSQASSGNDGNEMGHLFQDATNPSLAHTASYSYDNVMRLGSSVATGSSTHNLTFSYDRYGNMTCTTNQNTSGPCPNYTFNSSTNQITNTGFSYDAAGNLTGDGTGTGSHTYQWDAENRLKSIDNGSTATYTYNALGHRVEKNVGGTYTEYAYHASGEELGEHNRSIWSVQVIPFAGRHLAHYQSSGTYFNHSNALGSTSQVTDYSGAVAQDQLYYPWGQDWSMIGSAQEKRFAKLRHRDSTETGLDPTHFRMFSSTQGRWLAKDPKPGQTNDPQTMNRYSYVRNSPENFVDPSGLFMISRCGVGIGGWDEFDLFNIPGGLDILSLPGGLDPGTGWGCYPLPPVFFGGGGGGGGSRPQCFCQLKYRTVNIPGLLGAKHTFWYLQDVTGAQKIITSSATAERGPGTGYLNDRVTGNIWSDPWGDNVFAATWFNTGLSTRNCLDAEIMETRAYSWKQNSLKYSPWPGPNSNSFAHWLGQKAGLNPSPAFTFYGWYYPIFR